MITFEQYLSALRYALNHLYDPNVQRTSPLVALFGLGDRPQAGLALQQALLEAIDSLKVGAEVPLHSPLRRAYELLLFRYVQQFSQQEVADQFGISARHLRREQQLALELLAQRLRGRFALALEAGPRPAAEPVEPSEEGDVAVSQELAWLQSAPPAEPVALSEVLPAALALAQPMAREHGVLLLAGEVASLPPLLVHPVALRQVLLSLVGMGIRHAAGGRVAITAAAAGWGVSISVRTLDAPPGPISAEEAVSLGIVRHLLRACRGRLELTQQAGPWTAVVVLPAQEQVVVLAIDDNADTLTLIRRYLSGTRYRFRGAQSWAEALTAAQDEAPRLILLDVMMPEMDGWELLGRLRQHPLTRAAPIIICTILAEEDLALSLGASALLKKPFSREALLAALDRQAEG